MPNLNKVTAEQAEGRVAFERYTNVPGTSLVICILELENGWQATGESSPVDSDAFDLKTGMRLARAEAIAKVRVLESYLLIEDIYRNEQEADEYIVVQAEQLINALKTGTRLSYN